MIKTKSTRECRLLLKKIKYEKLNVSSIYIMDNYYYIIVASLEIVDQKLINRDSFMAIDHGKYYSHSNFNLDEYEIIAWAKSEIIKSVKWIIYESKSILMENYGRKYSTILRSFKPLTETMAIINYTSDSFSDGGKYNNIEYACAQIIRQIEFGANIIDLGVESTRPNAVSLDYTQELSRLKEILPSVLSLKKMYDFKLSIDTYHSENIEYLLEYDVDIINDVSGNLDINALKIIIDSGKTYIAMHSLSIPANKELIFPLESNPVNIVYNWMENKLEQLRKIGFKTNKIILDPGIGFGTNSAQAWYTLQNIDKFMRLPCEILIGHSRKSLFNHVTTIPANERDLVTNYISSCLANKNVDYLRLHDVELFYKFRELPLI